MTEPALGAGRSMDDSQLASLLERMSTLEREREILATMYAYGHAIDYGRHDDWLDCFVDSGVFEIRVRSNGVVRRYEGQAELRAFIVTHTFAPEKWHKHMLVEPRISATDAGATAVSYFARLDEIADRLDVHAFGRYVDRFEPCDDGRWRFAERVVEVEAIDRPGPLLASGAD